MILLAAGLSTANPLVESLSTISRFISVTASFATVGALLSMGFLLLDHQGSLGKAGLRFRLVASISALTWFIASSALSVTTVANILGTSLSSAIDLNTLKSFLTQIALGQYMFFQTLVALFVSAVVLSIKKTGGAIALLFICIIGIIAPVFQSHAASSGSHALAIGSLAIHVIALAFWVGGIIAISLLGKEDRLAALPRFSALALWAAIATVLSGSANAWARMNFAAAWETGYAKVLLLKISLTVILLYLAYENRKRLAIKTAMGLKTLMHLIFAEIVVMLSATFLGSWLSSHQSPEPAVQSTYDAAISIAGVKNPGEPNLWKVLTLYDPDAFILGAIIVAVALYIKGVRVLSKRGDRWPVGRTVAFALGLAAIDFATSGGLGVYAKFSFEYHMIAHMILGMIAPIGIVLGAPITLALRTLPIGRNAEERGVRGTLITILHAKATSIVTNPVVVLAIFDGSLFVLYFTSLFGQMMQSHAGHLFMNVHFILAGILFFHVIIGVDPNPRKVPHIVRIVILFAAMSIHAFFSIALISTSTLLDQGYYKSLESPWLGDLLADQHAGGSIGWAMGEIPILLALVATFIQWMRDDSREAKRIDRNEARLAAMGQPDELAEYNLYLSKLNTRDEKLTLKAQD